MPKGKRYTKRELPPNPDPERYITVCCSDGKYYHRLMRGQRKPARLNSAFLFNQQITTMLSPAARAISQALKPYTYKLETPRFHNNLLNALRKFYKEQNQLGYSYCTNIEIQNAFPLDRMLCSPIKVVQQNNIIDTSFSVNKLNCPQLGPLLTEYWFQAILLAGNPLTPSGISVTDQQSELFSYLQPPNLQMQFHFELPASPWMLLLKMSCYEGIQVATHPGYHPIKIIAAG